MLDRLPKVLYTTLRTLSYLTLSTIFILLYVTFYVIRNVITLLRLNVLDRTFTLRNDRR